ncbi:hypothetical protein AOQ84DRAFT_368747 [Glonium stellatum]|uniref:Fido domain-containing protein n=1 Tax=Glonium stellatum TaxID=574774 RepID=A0A8E2JN97_9PEZI|nr:hypothetical protein AOQ84DRAFT_368747 [Glonium stellatum]
MVSDFNAEVVRREKGDSEERDDDKILEMAARYCHVFANIHPFAHGNGRMCRILLNVILLKFRGICISIGAEGHLDRAEYLALANRAGRAFFREHGIVEWGGG